MNRQKDRLTGSILVAGAGGGIGAALVDALAARTAVDHVYALHRLPVCSTSGKITWLTADLNEPPTVEGAIEKIRTETSQNGGISGIIIATGLLHGDGLRPEKSLAQVEQAQLLELYAANAVAPLMLLRAARSLLITAEAPFVCMLSAQVGSIGDNRLGGWYGSRMAKAALNMAVKTAAIELARDRNAPVLCAVHPGTTHSALSRPFVRGRQAPVSRPQHAARRLLTLIEQLSPEHNGAFLNYDGVPLPW